MRILFSSLGSHGHVYPILPLAIAAREQGHDVLYAVDSGFHATVEKLGLTVVDAGVSIWDAFRQANELHGTSQFRRDMLRQTAVDAFGSVLPRAFVADLEPVLERDKPDLVVFELINPGAGLAAMRAGIPAVCHGFGKMDGTLVPEAMSDLFLEYVAELGITLPNGHHYGLGSPYVDVFPPSLQDLGFLSDVERIPMRPVPFAEPGELPGWVTEHARPLVYLTFGTAFSNPDLLRTAIAGLSGVDAEVLVATGPQVEPSALTDVPGNVHVLPWVPQADLLAHADLVVHHGGAGTTVSAMTHGLPQLVLPQGADQFRNGEIVADTGLGAHLVADQFTADAVRETAGKLLRDPGVREANARIAAEIAAMPHPHDVVPKLVELAG
ncbi:glycosyltransferase, MGT family [Lentzea xinjiangensis]|uniref:Glycosyltransferase, MGT family n=1 Tax=Lentzea xinjiangensis TaxID=402600 RepID=A0A1H9MJP3_9PSEU|nr:glycosyltransferase [Lentzea xinjiangensis]SER23922.1 glycosyltransferase, MGT family [Lentzea xinjiangensis]